MELRLSTACTIDIGPMVDSTDGNTEETGLTIAQANVLLAKNGGLNAQKNNADSAVYDANGVYKCALSTTDTNTAGRLKVFCHPSGALAWWDNFKVISAADYDRKYGTGTLTVDAMAATPLTDIFNKVAATAMTESYAAAGAAPTIAQALLALTQEKNNAALSDTTLTVKKLNGTDTAATFTLDSSTTPATRTRAT